MSGELLANCSGGSGARLANHSVSWEGLFTMRVDKSVKGPGVLFWLRAQYGWGNKTQRLLLLPLSPSSRRLHSALRSGRQRELLSQVAVDVSGVVVERLLKRTSLVSTRAVMSDQLGF